MSDFTPETLKQLFEYKDGNLYWRDSNGRAKAGSLAGCSTNLDKYMRVRINNKLYLLHRVIFFMHHGYFPKEIDHIDCDRRNNRIENLREATGSQNQKNRGLPRNNTSGYKNVTWCKSVGKWQVGMSFKKKFKKIGFFDDIELADLVAQEARNKYHGEFVRHV
jgi:hypothetical protein